MWTLLILSGESPLPEINDCYYETDTTIKWNGTVGQFLKMQSYYTKQWETIQIIIK